MRHTLGVLVENQPGVLSRVSGLFSGRGFNIESISAGHVNHADLVRITITTTGDEKTIEQVVKQLNKLIDVIKVTRLDPVDIVTREMALIKVRTIDTKVRSDIMNYADVFRGRVVDVSPETLIVEITGASDKINAFLNLMKAFGIIELARTGITALSRGLKSLRLEDLELKEEV